MHTRPPILHASVVTVHNEVVCDTVIHSGCCHLQEHPVLLHHGNHRIEGLHVLLRNIEEVRESPSPVLRPLKVTLFPFFGVFQFLHRIHEGLLKCASLRVLPREPPPMLGEVHLRGRFCPGLCEIVSREEKWVEVAIVVHQNEPVVRTLFLHAQMVINER